MNQAYVTRAYVAWNLEEASEQLGRIVAGMAPDAEVDEADLRIALAHVYDHLNTAWNSRNATADETAQPSRAQFDQWRRFPKDLETVG